MHYSYVRCILNELFDTCIFKKDLRFHLIRQILQVLVLEKSYFENIYVYLHCIYFNADLKMSMLNENYFCK